MRIADLTLLAHIRVSLGLPSAGPRRLGSTAAEFLLKGRDFIITLHDHRLLLLVALALFLELLFNLLALALRLLDFFVFAPGDVLIALA